MLLGIFIIFLLLSENGFINAKVQFSSLTKSQKRFSNELCNILIFIVHFLELPLSAAHQSAPFVRRLADQHFLTACVKSFNFILKVCFKMITLQKIDKNIGKAYYLTLL